MPGEEKAPEKVCMIPTADDVCMICQESTGIRVDKCADYKCQCRGMFFHEPCYEPFKGSACPICRANEGEVHVELNPGVDEQRQIQVIVRRMNEEAKQAQETKITIWIISPFLVAAYVTTIVYAILACREWDTYSDFQKVTIIGLIIINVYMIMQIAYTLARPEAFLLHSKSRLNKVIQVILLSFAVMAMVVYFQNPEVYNLKVASGITALITICSFGIIFTMMCVVVFMGACEYLYG